MNGPPTQQPIGITLASVARDVDRAFDRVLEAAGGSRPVWLVLIALKQSPGANQRELAARIGIQGATLTHHLNAMDAAGLITRRRDPANRRVHIVEMTGAGEAAFHHLRGTVAAFDRRLRAGLAEEEIATLRGLLERLRRNVSPAAPANDAPAPDPAPPLGC